MSLDNDKLYSPRIRRPVPLSPLYTRAASRLPARVIESPAL